MRTHPESYDFIIVGSGITALSLGRDLQISAPRLKTVLLEKSKGCGGRMATRRIDNQSFDHGAQFIKKTMRSEKLIEFWKSEGVLRGFPSHEISAFCGVGGMTRLAKSLAQNLEIEYNCKVIGLKKGPSGWIVQTEDAREILTQNVILTAPLPQSLEILERSGVPYDPELNELVYSKGLAFLFNAKESLPMDSAFLENLDQDIFSICSQQEKGLCDRPAYTVVMSASWSEKFFNESEEAILDSFHEVLSNRFEALHFQNMQLKKWRYCQPIGRWRDTFYSPTSGVFLAGDSFGGASLNGALKSAKGLFDFLK